MTFRSCQILAFASTLRESRPDCGTALATLLDDLAASRTSLEGESRITRRLADWAIREALPMHLEDAGLPRVAHAIRAEVAAIVDRETTLATVRVLRHRIIPALADRPSTPALTVATELATVMLGMLHDVARAGKEQERYYDPGDMTAVAAAVADLAGATPRSEPVALLVELLALAEGAAVDSESSAGRPGKSSW